MSNHNNHNEVEAIRLHTIEHRRDEWTVRIATPGFEALATPRTISAGSFNSTEAHGMLVTVSDPKDLRTLARALRDAADRIETGAWSE